MSSKHKSSFPSYILVYSSFKIMFLAFPIWRGPDGNGASLIVTFLFSAFGNSFSPSLITLLEVLEVDFSNCSFWDSGDRLFTSFSTLDIVGMMSFIFDFSNPS